MEEVLLGIIKDGNTTAIIAALLVYLIIYYQRRNTEAERKNEFGAINKKISNLETANELIKKDVDHLNDENLGIKEDIKEIKATLAQMALTLERLTTIFENKTRE